MVSVSTRGRCLFQHPDRAASENGKPEGSVMAVVESEWQAAHGAAVPLTGRRCRNSRPWRATLPLGSFILCWLCKTHLIFAGIPAMRVVSAAEPGLALIANGNFEQAFEGKPLAWATAPNGCALGIEEGRNGSSALRCVNPNGNGWYGASQTITLNRTNARPLAVRGWSKAANVNGSGDSDYSLYIDLLYTDGTPLWGQTANFRTGTHDWERKELLILPEKPVKSLTVHCLFRNHSGKAWFDDIEVTEVMAQNGTVLFQGVPVMAPRALSPPPFAKGGVRKFSTLDGLTLAVRDDEVVSLNAAGKELAAKAPSG